MPDPIMTKDEAWLLSQAAQQSGFTPHAESVKEGCVGLETAGWLRRSLRDPVWFITDAGRAALAKFTPEN